METYVSQRRREGWCVVLTANLARSRTTDEEVKPLFIDPTDGRYRETARELIQLFDDHLGEPKGDLEDSIDELTVADTDYKIVQGLAKLLKDECEFEVIARSNRVRSASACSRKPTSGIRSSANRRLARTHRNWKYTAGLQMSWGSHLEDCYRGMYADLEANKRLVRIGTRTAEQYASDGDSSTATTTLTGSSAGEYEHTDLTVDWLLTRYNLALAQSSPLRRDGDADSRLGPLWDGVQLREAVRADAPYLPDRRRRRARWKYGSGCRLRSRAGRPSIAVLPIAEVWDPMANFLPALPLCDRWEMAATILIDETTGETRQFTHDHTENLDSHYSAGEHFDSDIERTLAQKNGSARTRTGNSCARTTSLTWAPK